MSHKDVLLEEDQFVTSFPPQEYRQEERNPRSSKMRRKPLSVFSFPEPFVKQKHYSLSGCQTTETRFISKHSNLIFIFRTQIVIFQKFRIIYFLLSNQIAIIALFWTAMMYLPVKTARVRAFRKHLARPKSIVPFHEGRRLEIRQA